MLDFGTLPNFKDLDAVRNYLQTIANQIKDTYKVKYIEVNDYQANKVINEENVNYEVIYYDNVRIYIEFKKKDTGELWWIEITLYDPTDNDCIEDKTCVYRTHGQCIKTYEGFGGIDNAKELEYILDRYIERKAIEEIRLF